VLGREDQGGIAESHRLVVGHHLDASDDRADQVGGAATPGVGHDLRRLRRQHADRAFLRIESVLDVLARQPGPNTPAPALTSSVFWMGPFTITSGATASVVPENAEETEALVTDGLDSGQHRCSP
jgi:hypothetical protein